MKPKASVIRASSPRIHPSRNIHPFESQVCPCMICKEHLDIISVVRMSNGPDLMLTRELPCPVPSKASFRTQAGATSMPDEQDFHFAALCESRLRLQCRMLRVADPVLEEFQHPKETKNHSHSSLITPSCPCDGDAIALRRKRSSLE